MTVYTVIMINEPTSEVVPVVFDVDDRQEAFNLAAMHVNYQWNYRIVCAIEGRVEVIGPRLGAYKTEHPYNMQPKETKS